MIRIFVFVFFFDIKQSVLSICNTQHYSISPQHYAEIFASSGTIFSNIDALRCVYNCAVSGEDIGLRLAVYHKEPKLCSCFTSGVLKTDVLNAIRVQVVEVKGWYRKDSTRILQLDFVSLQNLINDRNYAQDNVEVQVVAVLQG